MTINNSSRRNYNDISLKLNNSQNMNGTTYSSSLGLDNSSKKKMNATINNRDLLDTTTFDMTLENFNSTQQSSRR
jgi:hypothetical protein